MLLAVAFANGWAEEIVVVAFLVTRLRQLGLSPTRAAHRLQPAARRLSPVSGLRRRVGNIVMGLVFGYAWRRTRRLWPLIIAHGLIDAVAFVGYALLAGHLGWLR